MFLVIPYGKLIIFFTWPYCENILPPGSPLTYFNGRGVGSEGDCFGSEILAKSDFFGSMKNARIFRGHEKNQ